MHSIRFLNHKLMGSDRLSAAADWCLPPLPGAPTSRLARVAAAALPLLALYRPVGRVATVGCEAAHAYTHFRAAWQAGTWQGRALPLLKGAFLTAAATSALLGHPLALFCTQLVDTARSLAQCAGACQEGQYGKALEELTQAALTLCYAGFLWFSVLEYLLLSTLLQAALYLHRMRAQCAHEQYLEAGVSGLMAGMRIKQCHTYWQGIRERNALEAIRSYFTLRERVAQGKKISSLLSHPLQSLEERVQERAVFLPSPDGEPLYCGAHFHGYGGALVKGQNLAFRTRSIEGKEVTELEFQINHIAREGLAHTLQDLEGMDPELLKRYFSLVGSHATALHIEQRGSFEQFSQTSNDPPTCTVQVEGLGSVQVGVNSQLPNFYSRVVIQLEPGAHLYHLYELTQLLGLHPLTPSTPDDRTRLKMAMLFYTLHPRESTALTQNSSFFTEPLAQLEEDMIAAVPSMREELATYLPRMIPRELLPGRVRYYIPGMGKSLAERGTPCLISAVTGSTSELYHRVAAILTQGLLSRQLRHEYGLNKTNGIGWFDFASGGADSVFAQLVPASYTTWNVSPNRLGYYMSSVHLLIDPDVVGSGTYQSAACSCGNRFVAPLPSWQGIRPPFSKPDRPWPIFAERPSILELATEVAAGTSPTGLGDKYARHEVMLKDRLDPSAISGILISANTRTHTSAIDIRDRLLEELRNDHIIQKDVEGKEWILGHPVESFFILCGQTPVVP